MGKKQRRTPPVEWLIERGRTRLLIRIAGIYCLTLLVLVFLAISLNIPLYFQGNGILRLPTPYLFLLWIFYYIVPLVVSIVFGMILRPFWPQFRNLLITILVIQGIYSLIVFALRIQEINRIENDIDQSKSAHLKAKVLSHEFLDADKDRIVEKMGFVTEVNVEEFPLGEYMIYATLTQSGEPIFANLGTHRFARNPPLVTQDKLPDVTRDKKNLWQELIQRGYINDQGVVQEKFKSLKNDLEMEDLAALSPSSPNSQRPNFASYAPAGRSQMRMQGGGRPVMTYEDKKRMVFSALLQPFRDNPVIFSINFQTDLQSDAQYIKKGELELNVGIRKVMTGSENAKRILQWSRWAPFLRSTSWEGEYPEISATGVDLDFIRRVDTFSWW